MYVYYLRSHLFLISSLYERFMHVKIVQKITFVHHMFAIKIVMNRRKYAVGVLETVFANHFFLIECL